jgi:hypothetical protein
VFDIIDARFNYEEQGVYGIFLYLLLVSVRCIVSKMALG